MQESVGFVEGVGLVAACAWQLEVLLAYNLSYEAIHKVTRHPSPHQQPHQHTRPELVNYYPSSSANSSTHSRVLGLRDQHQLSPILP